MKNILKYIILSVSITAISMSFVQAQTKKAFLQEAEKNFVAKNYYAALVYFERALEFNERDTMVLWKAAESARLFNSYKKAINYYSTLIDSMQYQDDPSAVFHLASMFQKTGKYDKAETYYKMFLTGFETQDSLLLAKAGIELKAIDFARTLTSSGNSGITLDKVKDINTTYSETGAQETKDGLLYSSMQFEESNPALKPAREISKLMKKKKNQAAAIIPGEINTRDLLVSNPSLSPDGKKLYYTVCQYINASDIRCQIYSAKVMEDGTLTEESMLPDPVNIEGFTATHPHVTTDRVTGKEVIYFVSDRPAGKGGLDIWYSVFDAKFGYSQPVNLQDINTPYDEITPFYQKNSGFLYFSSDGRNGLGGFDIYKSQKISSGYGDIMNIGIPFNSSYHDIYYTVNDYDNRAYLSSNREGALFLDDYHESCCYDIYMAELSKIELALDLAVFDEITGRPLKKATIKMFNRDTQQLVRETTNQQGNTFFFDLEKDKNYYIIIDRPNYFTDTFEISTLDADKSDTIMKKIFLSTDMMLIDAFTFSKIGKFALDSVKVEIKNKLDTMEVFFTEINPDGNDFYFMLDRGKEYVIIGSKDGYTRAVEDIDTRPFSKSGLIKKELLLDKFTLPDLLPLAIYFDNDSPDPKSRSPKTKTKYSDLVASYVGKKQLYKDKYAGRLVGEEKAKTEEEIENFFEGTVMGEYDKLQKFMEFLILELKAGNRVELKFMGFTSPRADVKYNKTLGERRVHSVSNELIVVGGDVIKKYMSSGQLKILELSFGKDKAPIDVTGDLKDERNSIYSVRAARERRVEIVRAARN